MGFHAPRNDLKTARAEVHALLATAEHYCICARLHLEVADDPVALMDLQSARLHFVRAIEAFGPIREALKVSRQVDAIPSTRGAQ